MLPRSSKAEATRSRLYPGTLYATAGIHPHDAKSWDEDEDTLSLLKDLVCNPEVVAVGECGLDFNRNFSPPNVQLDVFEKQVCMTKTCRYVIVKCQNPSYIDNFM